MTDGYAALSNLLEVWDEYTVADLGPHMTCTEADVLAAFFKAAGREDLADALIAGHAVGDDEGDAHYEEAGE